MAIPRKGEAMNKRIELSYKPNCGRSLFVVDIENVVGYGRIDDAMVVREMNRMRVRHRMSATDMVVVGVSHSSNVFPASVWKGARLVFARERMAPISPLRMS